MPFENFWLIALIIFVAFDLFIIWYIFRWWKKRGFTQAQKAKYQEHWQRILSYEQLHQAVMEADKLLDAVLNAKNYKGSLGEKLKQTKGLFSDYNGVWFAHKLRNRLAHEINVYVNDNECKKALGQFEKALKDLGAL